jgi:hypothetical protein
VRCFCEFHPLMFKKRTCCCVARNGVRVVRAVNSVHCRRMCGVRRVLCVVVCECNAEIVCCGKCNAEIVRCGECNAEIVCCGECNAKIVCCGV